MGGGGRALLPSASACFRSGLATFGLTPLRGEPGGPYACLVV